MKKESASLAKGQTKKTKVVRNRSGHKIELLIDQRVVVFLPGKSTEVPVDFEIPSNVGLYVR